MTRNSPGPVDAIARWAGAGHNMNWNEDRWSLLGVGAYADFRYDFFGVGAGGGEAGRSIPLRQTMAGSLVELLRAVDHSWYVGGRYHEQWSGYQNGHQKDSFG